MKIVCLLHSLLKKIQEWMAVIWSIRTADAQFRRWNTKKMPTPIIGRWFDARDPRGATERDVLAFGAPATMTADAGSATVNGAPRVGRAKQTFERRLGRLPSK
jgi:hypothetical protein